MNNKQMTLARFQVRKIRQDDAPGVVSCRDGSGGALDKASRVDRADVSERGRRRPAVPLERMLRIYFLQQWFNLGDPAVEKDLYDSASMRAFAGIDLALEPVPDETTVCKFRHLLERNNLGTRIFQEVGRYLQSPGLRVSSGTIVDATIISAPSSTKNAEGKRDPEMRQTKKGKDWHFGMKAHVGVDRKTKLIHSAR